MAKFIDDLGYSKKNPFSATREERELMRQKNIQRLQKRKDCFKPQSQSSAALNYFNENPILGKVSQFSNGEPWVIEFTNTSAFPREFELFNANVNYNSPEGGIPGGVGLPPISNDYQARAGAKGTVTGSKPPYNPIGYDAVTRTFIPGVAAPTWQEMLYEVIENPLRINQLFFQSNDIDTLLSTDLVIRYKDGNGNFQQDRKKLMMDPYARVGNYTIDSPITVMIDGFAQVMLEEIPAGETVKAIIYPDKNISPSDCLYSHHTEAMRL